MPGCCSQAISQRLGSGTVRRPATVRMIMVSGSATLVGIKPGLEQVVSPGEGFAPITGIENPVAHRDHRRRIQ